MKKLILLVALLTLVLFVSGVMAQQKPAPAPVKPAAAPAKEENKILVLDIAEKIRQIDKNVPEKPSSLG